MRRLTAIAFFVIILLSADISAQQQPVYSQYILDKYLVNPSVAGANGLTNVNFISRQQYVGFENAPRTFTLNVQSRLLEDSYILRRMKLRSNATRKSRSGRVGLGGSLFTDRNGLINRTGLQGTYAYHLNFGNQWQLSGGISFMGYQFSIDDRDVPLADLADPLLANSKKSFFVPDANVGVFATNGNLYGGITMTDLLASKLKIGREVYANYETLRKYNVLAGYKVDVTSTISVEPSFLLQGTRTNFSLDLNAMVNYTDNYWAGLSYRSNSSVVLMLGGRFDMFHLSYAFDLNMGPINTYTSGSHEVIFGLRIGDNNLRRFRWFRQDQRNFDI
jgi:type IX secretion system PorP/SprF family membrane protein